MVKIYTKGGDGGTTSLFGGKRVNKNNLRVAAYGQVDELNSYLGVIVAMLSHPQSNRGSDSRLRENDNNKKDVLKKLTRIQNELFVLGSDLASPYNAAKIKTVRVSKNYISRLEKEIDTLSRDLPQLKNFILPGGSQTGSQLHLARSIARRAERAVVEVSNNEKVNKNALVYLNRLSDWLFMLARYVNKLDNVKETPWKGRG